MEQVAQPEAAVAEPDAQREAVAVPDAQQGAAAEPVAPEQAVVAGRCVQQAAVPLGVRPLESSVEFAATEIDPRPVACR